MKQERQKYDDPGAIRLEQRGDGGRYVYSFPDGQEAEMIFVERMPGVLVVTHTNTPPEWRGRGTAAALVARFVSDIRERNQKAIPMCWFVRDEFGRHPEWRDLIYQAPASHV